MNPITRQEQYLARIAGDTDFPLPEYPRTREEQYLARIAAQSGGTTDYTNLENKPQINGVELSGNKTAAQLNVAWLDESGKVPMSILPPAAIERLVVVADDAARFALTIDTVQLGDTVKVTSTNKMYMVIDTDHLDSESGYSVYVAGRAAEAVADEDGNRIKATYLTMDSNGNLFVGSTQITQLIDQDSYDALVIKENRFYLVYPTPANNGGE